MVSNCANGGFAQDFLRHARLYIFETYCRIHERIDLRMLAQKLGMEQVAPPPVSRPTCTGRCSSTPGHHQGAGGWWP